MCPTRWAGLVVVILLVAGGCTTTGRVPNEISPPATGVFAYDTAMMLVRSEYPAVRLRVYVDIADVLIERDQVELSVDLLGYVTDQLDSQTVNQVERFELLAGVAGVWSALATIDESYVPMVEQAVFATVSASDAVDDPAMESRVFLTLFERLIDANTGEAAVRRALDMVYFIPDDGVRSRTLLQTAELLYATDDRAALNPLVQQAIATLPALDDPLLVTDLSVRLAYLTDALLRTNDSTLLSDQVRRRVEQGFTVRDVDFPHLTRILAGLVKRGDLEIAEDFLANIAPRSARAIGTALYGYELHVRGERERARVFLASARMMADQLSAIPLQIATRARIARIHAEALSVPDAPAAPDDQWSVEMTVDAERLRGEEDAVRERVLTDLTVAYHLTGDMDQLERARAWFVSQDEFARVRIFAAAHLARIGYPIPARALVGSIQRVPDARAGDAVSPAESLAAVWRAVGEYDLGLVTLVDFDPTVLAHALVALPIDHQINPATRSQIASRAE